MIWALAHASTHWLLQIVASTTTLLLGPAPWTAGPLLIGFLFLLRVAGQKLAKEAHERPRLAIAACLLGQAPGLALTLFVAIGFAGAAGDPFASVVLLQSWTAIWAALISLVPDLQIRARSAYLWVTLALPIVQLAWLMAPLVRPMRQGAFQRQPAAGATDSRSWTPPG